MLHTSRSFQELPGPMEASKLLQDMPIENHFEPPAINLPLALYGNGNLGRMAKDYLKYVGCKPAQFFEYDELADTDNCAVVCIVTSAYVPIEQKLSDKGFKSVIPFYDLTENFRHLHPLSNGWFANLTNEDKEQINIVLMNWGDDVSRAHHLQFIAWRTAREEWSFESAPVLQANHQFFIPEIISVLHDHEVFVDGGAYQGNITQEFINQTENNFDLIVAYEPDLDNRRAFRKNVPQNTRIEMIPYALHEKDGVATFHFGLGVASQISETGKDHVATYALDSFHLPTTFIKLHLEGAELATLNGARKTLLEKRPIVASTICHNSDGLWKTPLWLMDLLDNYTFLFRLHCWCGSAGIIYAIPNERMK